MLSNDGQCRFLSLHLSGNFLRNNQGGHLGHRPSQIISICVWKDSVRSAFSRRWVHWELSMDFHLPSTLFCGIWKITFNSTSFYQQETPVTLLALFVFLWEQQNHPFFTVTLPGTKAYLQSDTSIMWNCFRLTKEKWIVLKGSPGELHMLGKDQMWWLSMAGLEEVSQATSFNSFILQMRKLRQERKWQLPREAERGWSGFLFRGVSIQSADWVYKGAWWKLWIRTRFPYD